MKAPVLEHSSGAGAFLFGRRTQVQGAARCADPGAKVTPVTPIVRLSEVDLKADGGVTLTVKPSVSRAGAAGPDVGPAQSSRLGSI